MISGFELFFSLFNNLAIFIALVSVYGFLISHFEKTYSLKKESIVGLTFGVFALACMYAKIPVYEGVIVDQRNAIIALSGIYGGPLSAILSAVMAGLFRIHLGGSGVVAGVVGVTLAAMAGICLNKFLGTFENLQKGILGSLLATIIILPGFLLVGDIHTGWNLMKAMSLPYGSAIFVGILLAGLLLNRQDSLFKMEKDRKRSEEEIHLFNELINKSNDAIFVINPETAVILDANATACNNLGYTREELLALKVSDIDAEIQDQFAWDEHVKEIRTSKFLLVEGKHRRKNGTTLPMEINVAISDYKGHEYIVAVARDLTERKSLESRLNQAQKMEAIGTLSGGIAHDFNNILSAILGYTELALDIAEENSIIAKNLQHVKQAGDRAVDLVKQILTFSRESQKEKKPIQVGLIIKEAAKLLRSSIPATIDIKQNIQSSSVVLADPTQIHQIVMNLSTNAYHAMRETGGTLEIELKDIEFPGTNLQSSLNMASGKYILLSVSDTGTGIDDSVIDKIFEPYFTSKEKGEGTGLGLAVVHGIVKDHAGNIEVFSTLGKGTTFNIYLPVVDQGPVELTISNKDEILTGGNERIMVVDDEEEICTFLESALQKYGYDVFTYQNGVQALQDFKKEPDRYDLVMSDITMPYMTGKDLASKLIEVKPDVAIILFSGHTDLINKEDALAMGVKDFYQKPLALHQVIKKVREVLDNNKKQLTKVST